MEINLTTPALLFPALSLLLLAYTNRFVVLAGLIRSLHERYLTSHEPVIFEQIVNLRRRVVLIRNMQAAGILSLLCCVVAMLGLFFGRAELGKWFFGLSLVLLSVSLALSFAEVWMSVGALNLVLARLADEGGGAGAGGGCEGK